MILDLAFALLLVLLAPVWALLIMLAVLAVFYAVILFCAVCGAAAFGFAKLVGLVDSNAEVPFP